MSVYRCSNIDIFLFNTGATASSLHPHSQVDPRLYSNQNVNTSRLYPAPSPSAYHHYPPASTPTPPPVPARHHRSSSVAPPHQMNSNHRSSSSVMNGNHNSGSTNSSQSLAKLQQLAQGMGPGGPVSMDRCQSIPPQMNLNSGAVDYNYGRPSSVAPMASAAHAADYYSQMSRPNPAIPPRAASTAPQHPPTTSNKSSKSSKNSSSASAVPPPIHGNFMPGPYSQFPGQFHQWGYHQAMQMMHHASPNPSATGNGQSHHYQDPRASAQPPAASMYPYPYQGFMQINQSMRR